MSDAIFSGWFLVNIIAPAVLPIFGLLVLRALPLGIPNNRVRMLTTVKDGQLCWIVVVWGASTIYELWISGHHKGYFEGLTLTGSVIVMLSATMLAAGGPVFTTKLLPAIPPPGTRPLPWKQYIKHYKIFFLSLLMTIYGLITFTAVHFTLESANQHQDGK